MTNPEDPQEWWVVDASGPVPYSVRYFLDKVPVNDRFARTEIEAWNLFLEEQEQRIALQSRSVTVSCARIQAARRAIKTLEAQAP